jgi:hypothetical protein
MEDSLCTLVEHLPGEVAEALFEIGNGRQAAYPYKVTPVAEASNIPSHAAGSAGGG